MTTLEDGLLRFFRPDAELMADPFPLYAQLREAGPAYRFKDRVLVSHFEPARELLVAPTTRQGLSVRGSRYRAVIDGLGEDDVTKLVELFGFYEKRVSGVDGDKHKRLRRLAQRAFTHRVVSQMEQRIQEITDQLLASVADRGTFEFVEEFAYHLPLIVICDMFDIPSEDRGQLRDWASDLGRFVGADWSDVKTLRETHRSVFAMREYLTGVFAGKRGGETTELMAALLNAEGDEEDHFTEDELVAVITQFVFAGHETTTNLMGNSMVTLLRDHREQWELLREQPELVPGAVEELLRYSGTTQYVDKLVSEDCEIGGVEVKAWDTVVVAVAAANRDETAFPDGERFDVTRDGKSHLSFGFGPHHCLGAALARIEMATLLRTLTRRFPEMGLVEPEHVVYGANSMLRGPERLPVRLGREHS
ncbi:cytochrome P450 [Nocardioides caldifontis]|uniref:cytochrome P450 n=1 Tax=Nocardioides caldifontis TaxID=2588938 RepID=UPI0011E06088|nr:cytochrome P450 [Nocardioides caldifontis]